MALDTCNLCGKSLSEKGSGGTTVGVSLATNQLTAWHTRCRDAYRNQPESIHDDADMYSPKSYHNEPK